MASDKLAGQRIAFDVASRKPDDLEAFCAKAVEELCEGEHAEQARSAS